MAVFRRLAAISLKWGKTEQRLLSINNLKLHTRFHLVPNDLNCRFTTHVCVLENPPWKFKWRWDTAILSAVKMQLQLSARIVTI